MKKIIFIMPLMAISLLASCGNNNPQKDEYIVNEQEMKDAFDMKDVEYLQVKRAIFENNVEIRRHKTAFTPTSYYLIMESPYYLETLIIKDGENYHQYERSNKENPFTPTAYTDGFLTISELADEVFGPIKNIKYENYYYDIGKKEYMTYDASSDSILVAFLQFYKKQVSEFASLDYISDSLIRDELSLSYDKIEPPSPTI